MMTSPFTPAQPQAYNPFANRGTSNFNTMGTASGTKYKFGLQSDSAQNGGITTMANNPGFRPPEGQPSGIRAPWQPYNPYLDPNQQDLYGRGPSGGYDPGTGRGSSGPGAVSQPAQGPAYNQNFDPRTGWGVPGNGLPGRPGGPRFGGGAGDMSAYNPAYDPSAQFGNSGSTRSGKGGGGVGGYGGGSGGEWWNNPAVQGMSDQTRALAPLYAQSTGAPGYLQKVIGRRIPPQNTQGQGMPGIG